MFSDTAFTIDKNSEAYKNIKTTVPTQQQESDDEDEKEQNRLAQKYKARNLNNLFAEKDDDDQSVASD